MSRCFRNIVLAAVSLAAEQAAAVTSVGPPPCNFATIQRAVDVALAAQRAGDFSNPDIIVAGGRYHEAVTVDARGLAGARLSIRGGFDPTCTVLDPQAATIIDADQLLASTVKTSGSIALQLSSLVITGGNAPGHGGGIDFNGSGSLDLRDIAIIENRAPFGAGIFANGFPPLLTVRLHDNNLIEGNLATRAGGGIHLSGEARLFAIDRNADNRRTNTIARNRVDVTDADGAGGGIKIVGPARADIGSANIVGNSARVGGGIAVDTIGNESGHLRFFRSNPAFPTWFAANSAADAGGGLYVNGGFPQGMVCGFGYEFFRNTARQGSAIHAGSVIGEPGGQLLLTEASIDSPACGPETATSLGAIPCGIGLPCNSIHDGRNQSPDGSATDGATVFLGSNTVYRAERLAMQRNTGGHLLQGAATAIDGELSLSNCLMADNIVSADLLRVLDGGKLQLRNCTLGGNDIAGGAVFSLSGDLALNESIVWQPGTRILTQAQGAFADVRNVIASEVASLPVHDDIIAIDPLFVEASSGDYHLQPGSPALDFATPSQGVDLDGLPRTVDLPGIIAGVLDLGAFERQSGAVFALDENFDEVVVPALPAGWTSTPANADLAWMTTPNALFTAPNSAFTASTTVVTDRSVVTPSFDIVRSGRLTFRHKAGLELQNATTGLDGVVLEISMAAGPFVDIVAAGGRFITGGYRQVIDACCDNPLAGRAAWSTTVGAFERVVVALPDAVNGTSVRLRWRIGSDYSVGNGGYWLDDVTVEADGPIFGSGFEAD